MNLMGILRRNSFEICLEMELTHAKKNKICLSDYDYELDIRNRILMSEFSKTDLLVLEEILYSTLAFPVERLARDLEMEEKALVPILKKLSKTGLFELSGTQVTVDKDMRKYFEFQILKFEDDFIPDLEFLHGMLKKVPIHVLPIWYSIPRSSDNIFQSLIDKYFLTPQAFQRYLMELNLGDPVLSEIVKEVFQAPNYKVCSKEIIKKHGLSKETFEEYMLLLEFNFLCCLAYDRNGDTWDEVVTPFREWREYLLFLQNSSPAPVSGKAKLVRKRPSDFAFVNDISSLLKRALSSPIPVDQLSSTLDGFDASETTGYLKQLLAKMKLLKLADVANQTLYPLEAAQNFLDMRTENQALFIYRHPLNRILSPGLNDDICTERNLREAEKSISRIASSGWVFFDEFMKGALIPLSENTKVILKKQGRSWKYTLPDYSDDEIHFIESVIFEWLFEAGIVAVGTQDDKPCFSVTPFGQTLFG